MADKKPLVSGELNESVSETGMVDDFLTQDRDASVLAKKNNSRATGGRPKSTAQSLRESIGFITTNKFGEGRRIEEDGDVADGRPISIKQRQSEKIQKLGKVATAASIFKAFVGLGVLFLPNQFYETGIVAMGCIMVGSLLLTLYCTSLLLETAENHGDSFSEIAEAAYGSKMKKLTEICIIMSQMAFCTNYVYFISSQMGSVINCAQPGANADTCALDAVVREDIQLWYFLPLLLIIYVPLVWIRDMSKLAWTHLLGDVIIVTVVVAIFTYAGMSVADNGGKIYFNPPITTQVISAVPYCAFAFEGVAVVLPLKNIVEDQQNFQKMVICVVSGICIFYILFAEWCNMAYGESMAEYTLIVTALPATSIISYVLKSLYTVNLFCSYPLMLSPAVNLIESYIFAKDSKPTRGRYWAQNGVRFCLVAFTITLALLVYPYITTFIEVVAAATCSPLAFTLPALFHWKLCTEGVSRGKRMCNLIIVIATVILTVYMVITSTITFVKEVSGTAEE